ncbi:Uncharacterised protein [uncultured archaeon]|nr:Uncharacterised protein [uncultured archaeon]
MATLILHTLKDFPDPPKAKHVIWMQRSKILYILRDNFDLIQPPADRGIFLSTLLSVKMTQMIRLANPQIFVVHLCFNKRLITEEMATKMHRLFLTLLPIIVLACLFGAQGQFQEQYVMPSSGYPTAVTSTAKNPSQYSQFYIINPGPAPSNPIGAPRQFEMIGSMPSTVYLGEKMQSVPYSQYRLSPAYTRASSLWIKGKTDWTQYAAVPQGSTLSLIAITPTGGSGSLDFVNSDGKEYSHDYFFYPNSLLTVYADTIGRHVLSFDINGQASNQVMIDVVGNYAQPSTYVQPSTYPAYYPGYYYPWDYYLWNYYPWDYYPDYWDNKVKCKPGFHRENGKCVPDVQCKPGYHQENGKCVPDKVECMPGYHPENGECMPDEE